MNADATEPLLRLRARVLPDDTPTIYIHATETAAIVPFADGPSVLDAARQYRARIVSNTRQALSLRPPRANGLLTIATNTPPIVHARALTLAVSRFWPDPQDAEHAITWLDAERMTSRLAARAVTIAERDGDFGEPVSVGAPWDILATLLLDEVERSDYAPHGTNAALLRALRDSPGLVATAVALNTPAARPVTLTRPVAITRTAAADLPSRSDRQP